MPVVDPTAIVKVIIPVGIRIGKYCESAVPFAETIGTVSSADPTTFIMVPAVALAKDAEIPVTVVGAPTVGSTESRHVEAVASLSV